MPSECEDLVKLLENIEQKTRINYAKILSAASWEKVRDTMNVINDRINFGLVITAIPEEFRSHATSHLESQVHREVSDIITRVQGNIDYDPSMLFLYEVLIHGEISADSYRILAMFPGIQPTVDIALCVHKMNMMVEVPGDFIVGVQARTFICTRQLPDLTVKLEDEIYMHTGKSDDATLFPLVLSMANPVYSYEPNAPGTVITCPSAGLGWRIEAVVQ